MSESDFYAQYPSLKDRVVLITGGASGIGAAIVEQFALQGARTAFLDIDQDSAASLLERLNDRCPYAPLFLCCDLKDISALREAVSNVSSRLGTIRVLVNNAANDDRHNIENVTPEYWDERMAVNLRHHFFAIQAVAPGMRKATSAA